MSTRVRAGERPTTAAGHGIRLRRILALPGVVVASLALAACAPGSLDADPPAASGSPAPSGSPSTSSTPEPTPEGERFDDVDLAAALEPIPYEPGDPARWGPWTTDARDAIVPGLDPAAFAAAPECAATVHTLLDLAPEEVVRGGYPYDGVLAAWAIVGRMPSAADAAAYVDALVAASVACAEVQGVAVVAEGATAIRGPFAPSEALDAAGMQQVLVGYDGSFHFGAYTLVAHDELVVVTPWSNDVGDPTAEAIAIVETQVAALDAAAGE